MGKCGGKHRLTIATLVAIVCGAIVGLILKYSTEQPWTKRSMMYLQFVGELFLRLVNMIILPLVVSSIVSASCNLSKSGKSLIIIFVMVPASSTPSCHQLWQLLQEETATWGNWDWTKLPLKEAGIMTLFFIGSIGMKTLYYYTLTTCLGITLSVILSQTIRPGELHRDDNSTIVEMSKNFVTTDVFLDLLRNLITENIVLSCLSQYQTILIEPSNETAESSIYEWEISSRFTDGTNILGLVFFSLLLGIALGTLDEPGKPLLNFFHSLSNVMMSIIERITRLAPIGVLFLIPAKILEAEDIVTMMSHLGIYVLTVFLGLIIHGFAILPMVYFAFTGKSPYKIISKIGPAFITACGTSSSTATVPVTIRCLDKIGINDKVSRFVAPLGATINMDGIALYETIGAIFIIQLRGLNISLIRVVAISITCTISCIGAAGLPNGGYMMLILVLDSIGIPANDVMLIIMIDCLVDRFRTTINIIADALGAGVIDHLTKDEDFAIEDSERSEHHVRSELMGDSIQ